MLIHDVDKWNACMKQEANVNASENENVVVNASEEEEVESGHGLLDWIEQTAL